MITSWREPVRFQWERMTRPFLTRILPIVLFAEFACVLTGAALVAVVVPWICTDEVQKYAQQMHVAEATIRVMALPPSVFALCYTVYVLNIRNVTISPTELRCVPYFGSNGWRLDTSCICEVRLVPHRRSIQLRIVFLENGQRASVTIGAPVDRLDDLQNWVASLKPARDCGE